jgi:hypothetical protein
MGYDGAPEARFAQNTRIAQLKQMLLTSFFGPKLLWKWHETQIFLLQVNFPNYRIILMHYSSSWKYSHKHLS